MCRPMSGDHDIVGVEEGFLLLSIPQGDDEELSWQYGSSDSLWHSNYVFFCNSLGLNVRDCVADMRKTNVHCRLSSNAQPVCELLPQGQQSLLSCVQENADPNANIGHGRVFEGLTSHEGECSHPYQADNLCSSLSQNIWQAHRSFSAQYYNEQLKSPIGSTVPSIKNREAQWVRSKGLPCTPELKQQNLLPKLHQSRVIRFSEDWGYEITTEQPEKLGEALCHSQTRARNAEELAAHVQIEKDQLKKLLFKEASTCCTYKERVYLLELENMWLKTQSECDMELPVACCKVSDVKSCCKLYKKGMSKEASSVPGMIGLAFALGLSCASACFMIGCGMGLVGLSQSDLSYGADWIVHI